MTTLATHLAAAHDLDAEVYDALAAADDEAGNDVRAALYRDLAADARARAEAERSAVTG